MKDGKQNQKIKECKVKREKFIFLSLVYIVLFGLVGCSQEDLTVSELNVKQTFTPEDTSPEQELKKFNIVQTNDGQKEWELEAKEAKIYEEKKQAIAEDIKVKFFEKDSVASILTAKTGRIHSESGDMEVEGNVIINSIAEETKIETEKLRYIAKEKKIVSDEFIKQTRPNSVITGYGLETDTSLEKVIIKRDVKSEVIDHKYIEPKSEEKGNK